MSSGEGESRKNGIGENLVVNGVKPGIGENGVNGAGVRLKWV